MKLYTQIAISLLCLISLLSSHVAGQDNYVLLSDLTGIERMDYETEMDPIIELQNDVNELAGSVFLDFKFYDVGLYLHSSVYEEEIDEYMNRIISDEVPTGAQYLIFARISDKNGIYSGLKFYSNLPESTVYCFNNSDFKISIQDYIDYFSISSINDVYEIQRDVINVIANQIKIKYICCNPPDLIQGDKKSNSEVTECLAEDEDLLANHNQKLNALIIKGWLLCHDFSIPNQIVQVTNSESMIYKAIENISYHVDNELVIGCEEVQERDISSIFKSDKENGVYVVRKPIINHMPSCLTGEDNPHTTYDFGAFKIYAYSNLSFDKFVGYQDIAYHRSQLVEIIERLNTNMVAEGDYYMLSNYIGCVLGQFDDDIKIRLLFALVNADGNEPTNFVPRVLDNIVDFFSGDYSTVIHFVLKSIGDYNLLFDRLGNNPHIIASLIDYIPNSFQDDIRISLIGKYNQFVSDKLNNNIDWSTKKPIVLPYEVDKFLFVFQRENLSFEYIDVENNGKKIRVNDPDHVRLTLLDQEGNGCPGDQLQFDYGISDDPFDLLYPVVLPSYKISGETNEYDLGTVYLIPAFVLPMFSNDVTNNNQLQGALLAIDALSIASGVGVLRSMIVRGTVAVNRMAFVFASAEVALTSLDVVLRLNETCQTNENCKSISQYVGILSLLATFPNLIVDLGPTLHKSTRRVEMTIGEVDKRKFMRLQPKKYLTYKLLDMGLDANSPIVAYSRTCGSEGRILNEMSDDVLRKMNTEANTSPDIISDIVQDLNHSKLASASGDISDLSTEFDDLTRFLNDRPTGFDTWKQFNKAFPDGPWCK